MLQAGTALPNACSAARAGSGPGGSRRVMHRPSSQSHTLVLRLACAGLTAMRKAALRPRPNTLGMHYREAGNFSRPVHTNPGRALNFFSDSKDCCSL